MKRTKTPDEFVIPSFEEEKGRQHELLCDSAKNYGISVSYFDYALNHKGSNYKIKSRDWTNAPYLPLEVRASQWFTHYSEIVNDSKTFLPSFIRYHKFAQFDAPYPEDTNERDRCKVTNNATGNVFAIISPCNQFFINSNKVTQFIYESKLRQEILDELAKEEADLLKLEYVDYGVDI